MGWLAVFKESPLCHLFLCITFIISGIIVILLQLLTLLLIRPFSKKLYQIIVCNLVYLHWGQLIWMCDQWSGSEVHLYGDDSFIENAGKEHCVALCNHRDDVDWLAAWVLSDRFHCLKQAKCLMKNDLKYVPFIGWSFYMLEMIFVKRDFARDKKTMIDGFRSYVTYPLNCLILIFCEGTRFTPEKYAKSLVFAKEKGLVQLKHHLVPRTKGFVVAMEAFDGQVPAIYDITFGITKSESEPTILNLLRGKKFIFNFHVKRIPIAAVPKDEEGQVRFIYDIYEEKDKLYGHFLENGTFAGYDHRTVRVMPWQWGPVIIEAFWLSVLGLPVLYQLFFVITTGPTWATATVLGVITALYFLIKHMISATITAKGSGYGVGKSDGIQNGNTSTCTAADNKSD